MKLRAMLIMLTIAAFTVAVFAPTALAAKAPGVTLKGPASVKHGVRVQVTGTVKPRTASQAKSTNPVKIYKLVGSAWKKVASVRVAWPPYGVGGTFKAKIKAGAKGTKLKLKASWTAAKLTGWSKVITITVK